MNLSRILLAAAITTLATQRLPAQMNCQPCDRPSTAGLVPAMIGEPGNFAVRRAGAEVDARWRVGITNDGWYRLTQPQLVAAGMPSDQLIGSQIRMFSRTQEVALLVSSSNLLGTADTVQFYAIKHDGAYNRTNVYWLGLGGEGRRIATINGTPLGGETLVTSACYSAVFDTKTLYRPFNQPLLTEIDHWFAALVNTSTPTVLSLNTTNRVSNETANIRFQMFGLTQDSNVNPDHRTRVTVSGSQVGQAPFDDTTLLTTNFFFSANLLSNGFTSVALQQNATGVTDDRAFLVNARVDYVARINQRSASHEFCGRTGTNRYRVLNLTSSNNVLYLDITDPYAPVRITGTFPYLQMPPTNVITNLWYVEFRHVTNRVSRFAVVQTNGVRAAPTPIAADFRNLADTNRSADYLLITPYEFRQQAYRLAKHRFTNGLRIAVAPLPDIYNEFGYGVVDADAIKQFIGYAYHHWTGPKPRFALLIGEGTYDPLGYQGSVPSLSIPVRFGPSAFVVSPQDTWYGFVDGNDNGVDDQLPDVVIGRMSLSSNAPLSNIVNKVIAFDSQNNVSNALLVADNDGVINFMQSSDVNIFQTLNSNGIPTLRHTRGDPGVTQATITNAINSNRRLITYVGHGAVDLWSAVNLLHVTNFPGLSNTVFPLVGIFSCQNGSYVDRTTNSLAEAFIEVPRGAASVYSPTALSVQLFADYLAAGFTQAYAVQKRRHLGDIVFVAHLNLWAFNPDVAELRTYQIIGDPGLIVNKPGTLP